MLFFKFIFISRNTIYIYLNIFNFKPSLIKVINTSEGHPVLMVGLHLLKHTGDIKRRTTPGNGDKSGCYLTSW